MNFPKTLRLPLVAIGLGLAGCTGAGPALEDQSANLDPHGPDLVVTAIATPPSFLPGDNTQFRPPATLLSALRRACADDSDSRGAIATDRWLRGPGQSLENLPIAAP